MASAVHRKKPLALREMEEKNIARRIVLVVLQHEGGGGCPKGPGVNLAAWHDTNEGDYLICTSCRQFAPQTVATERFIDDREFAELAMGRQPKAEELMAIKSDLASWQQEFQPGDQVASPRPVKPKKKVQRAKASSSSQSAGSAPKKKTSRSRKKSSARKSKKR